MSNRTLQERLDLELGIGALLAGPAGTGKSTMAASIAEFGKTHLVAFKPKEVDSFGYRKYDVTHDLFHDRGWSPITEDYEAGGFIRFLRRVDELVEDDDLRNVVFDPLTDLHHLIKHEVLAKENASEMGEMSDPRGAWGSIRDLWEIAAQKMMSLTYAPTPKNIVATVHTKVPTEEDENKRGVEYMGTTQPAIQGSFKNILEQEFHLVLHTKVEMEFDSDRREQVEQYRAEVRANAERHNKIALAPRMQARTIDNDFASLVEMIEEAREDE